MMMRKKKSLVIKGYHTRLSLKVDQIIFLHTSKTYGFYSKVDLEHIDEANFVLDVSSKHSVYLQVHLSFSLFFKMLNIFTHDILNS